MADAGNWHRAVSDWDAEKPSDACTGKSQAPSGEDMADGKVADDKWQMLDGRWQMAHSCGECGRYVGRLFLRPRHHCRKCGQSVCGDCSTQTVLIGAPPSDTLERACDRCSGWVHEARCSNEGLGASGKWPGASGISEADMGGGVRVAFHSPTQDALECTGKKLDMVDELDGVNEPRRIAGCFQSFFGGPTISPQEVEALREELEKQIATNEEMEKQLQKQREDAEALIAKKDTDIRDLNRENAKIKTELSAARKRLKGVGSDLSSKLAAFSARAPSVQPSGRESSEMQREGDGSASAGKLLTMMEVQ